MWQRDTDICSNIGWRMRWVLVSECYVCMCIYAMTHFWCRCSWYVHVYTCTLQKKMATLTHEYGYLSCISQHLALNGCIECAECVWYPLNNVGRKGSLPFYWALNTDYPWLWHWLCLRYMHHVSGSMRYTTYNCSIVVFLLCTILS